jgi:hypothetical protein
LAKIDVLMVDLESERVLYAELIICVVNAASRRKVAYLTASSADFA